MAFFALGAREQARIEFRSAALNQQRFLNRWALQLYLRFATPPAPRSLRLGMTLLRHMPSLAQVRYLVAMQLMEDQPQKAWELLVEAVPLAWEDPILLEDLMVLGLSRIQSQEHALRLGVQELHPELPYVFEECLDLLLRRHGDPRLPWDRTLPARHLALKGRHREVVSLALSVPLAQRSRMLWELLVGSLRHLGDIQGSLEALSQALDYQPLSFRLWMEQFYACVEAQDPEGGHMALEQAQRLLPPGTQGSLHWEWMAQRAGMAHWIEKNPATAWEYLEAIPEHARSNRLPILRVQVLAALGAFEEAHEGLRPILERHPLDAELQQLEAEILAGLEAWEALMAYTETAEALKPKADYWHLRGLALAHLKDFGPAREALERASYMAQGNLRFVLDAGHGCMDLYELERAEQHWRQALKLDPKCEEALIQLAETKRSLHDLEGARRLLRECLLHHPESEEAQTFLAELEAN